MRPWHVGILYTIAYLVAAHTGVLGTSYVSTWDVIA